MQAAKPLKMNLLRQWRIALMFYSRIPVGDIQNYQQADMHTASRWLPFVGLVIATILAGFWLVMVSIWPPAISLLLLFSLSVLLTGAFHEDGWADTWDGLGGGWSTGQKLSIMKDSRLGTYGGISLLLLVLLKYQLWLALSSNQFLISLIASMVLSRFVPLALITLMTYVREDGDSKSNAVINGFGFSGFIVIAVQLLVTLALLLYWGMSPVLLTIVLVVLLAVTLSSAGFFKWQIGGYTGDTLGASQQFSEVAVLLTMTAFLI